MLYEYSCPPEDEHIVARNMQRIQINILQKKLCVRLFTHQNYRKMHGQKNIKFWDSNLHFLYFFCLKNVTWNTETVDWHNVAMTSGFRIVLQPNISSLVGRDSSVRIVTRYGFDGPGVESRWGARFSASVETDPGAHPASCSMGTGSFLGVKSGRGVTLTPHPLLVPLVMKEQSYTSTPPMGRTACTEPQCLYKGDLYLAYNLMGPHSYIRSVVDRNVVMCRIPVYSECCVSSQARWLLYVPLV